jgi:hypothetical protein
MKKTVSAIIVAVLLTGLLLTGCRMEGSGNIETREFDFSDFTKVEIGSAFDFEISRSDSYGISITADDNLFENIQVTKEGKTLKIGIASRIALITIVDFGTTARKAVIRMPQLTGLDISGASQGIVSGFESTEELEVDVSGASELSFRDLVAGDVDIDVSGAGLVLMTGSVRDMVAEASGASRIELMTLSAGDARLSLSGASRIEGTLKADNIDFDLSGASSALMNGSTGDIRVEASGASRVNLANLTVNNADVTLAGASTAGINLDGKLDMSLSGASLLNYTGTPILGEFNLSGGSTINNINK